MNPSVQELVWWSVLSAFGAASITTILRQIPGISSLVAKNKKPWACNVCMPLYTVPLMVAIPIYLTGQWRYAVAILPAYAGANILLEHLSRQAPPTIPADLFGDNDPE